MRGHVLIAFPAYTGTVHVQTMRSVIADIMLLAMRGFNVSIADECGNAMIADCRAKIVADFVRQTQFTHLVMIDHDVSWEPGSLVKLVEHEVDFVCGMYPKRSDPLTFNFRSALQDGKGLEIDPATNLVEVWGVPAGFLCLKRACCEKMIAAYDELKFEVERGQDPLGNELPRNVAWALFDPYRPEGTLTKLGEDYAFCQRWRDIGGRVFIDVSIAMGHTGNKTFRGQLGQWFERECVEDAAPVKEAAE